MAASTVPLLDGKPLVVEEFFCKECIQEGLDAYALNRLITEEDLGVNYCLKCKKERKSTLKVNPVSFLPEAKKLLEKSCQICGKSGKECGHEILREAQQKFQDHTYKYASYSLSKGCAHPTARDLEEPKRFGILLSHAKRFVFPGTKTSEEEEGLSTYTVEYLSDQKEEFILEVLKGLGLPKLRTSYDHLLDLAWWINMGDFQSIHTREVMETLSGATEEELLRVMGPKYPYSNEKPRYSALLYTAITGKLTDRPVSTTQDAFRRYQQVIKRNLELNRSAVRSALYTTSAPVLAHNCGPKDGKAKFLEKFPDYEEDLKLNDRGLRSVYYLANGFNLDTYLNEERLRWIIACYQVEPGSLKSYPKDNLEALTDILKLVFPLGVNSPLEKQRYFFDTLPEYLPVLHRLYYQASFKGLEKIKECNLADFEHWTDIELIKQFGEPPKRWYTRKELMEWMLRVHQEIQEE